MNTYAKILVTAAAVLIVALVGYNLLPADDGSRRPEDIADRSANRDGFDESEPRRRQVRAPRRRRGPSATTVHLKVATIESATSPAAHALASFASEVTRSTGGQVVVDVTTQAVARGHLQGRAHPGDEAQGWRLRSRPGPDAGLGRRGCHVIPRDDGSIPDRQRPPRGCRRSRPDRRDDAGGTDRHSVAGIGDVARRGLRHPVSFGTPFLHTVRIQGRGDPCTSSCPTSRRA